MTKQLIIAYILGAITIAFAYHAYTVYSIKKVVNNHDIAILQIVDFINKANQQK
jgi:hypothetical protein